MMKTLVTWMTAMVVAGAAMAATVTPLPVQSQAHWGATHVLTLTWEDLEDETNDNTALTITNVLPVAANTFVELEAVELVHAFDTGVSWDTNSVALTIGDGGDPDLLLASTELASDGSEVLFARGRDNTVTVAITPTVTKSMVTLTYLSATDVTSSVAVVTNTYVTATAAVTQVPLGYKLYTSADTVDLTLTPSATRALADNTAGEVNVYLTIRH